MSLFKKILHKKDGFIAIIAIAIFALLLIFGATIQLTVVNTYENVKGLNNYYHARDNVDSAIEYAQYLLKDGKVGYNTGEIICKYGKYVNEAGVGANAWVNADGCSDFDSFAVQDGVAKDVKVKFTIKGRAEPTEKIKTMKCGTFNNKCYVVPFPGTGNAGENCKIYKPVFNNGQEGSENFSGVDQLQHPCNWNKLIFGSSSLDRVAIPFYYDDNGSIVNPFKTGAAANFALRLRTPCKPCGKADANGVFPAGTRDCSGLADPMVCDDNKRFTLKDGGGSLAEDQIVVQWRLSGKCDNDGASDFNDIQEDSCAMVADPDKGTESAIYESLINGLLSSLQPSVLLKNDTRGKYINSYPPLASTFLDFDAKLSEFSEPILSLFLSSALIDKDNKNIPYLEYQVLTDYPIGNSKTLIQVEVVVDDNAFVKTIFKDVEKDLIDFAVQN